MLACSACGRENPDDASFCAGCGTPLAAPVAPREERKVVSVVFVDLVGHTARSESADPEDVRRTLAPYHARARGELERFGGTVEKFIGDAVMAVFGAPVAHEDDAERAVRAALAVRDALVEDGLDVRVAVNTGEALVAVAARPELGEAMVAGDVVNTAARLQSAAPVNGVLVGAATHRATERVIEYRDAPHVDAKGKAQPVPAWEAVAPRARFGVDVRHHGAAELVGRDVELRLLRDALERARAGSPQLVTLVGVPGLGKSRLVWELYRVVEEELAFTHWRQGRALGYGGGAFGAIGEAVRAQVGMLETDSPGDVEEKLRTALATLPLEGSEIDWVAARVRPLLGLDVAEPAPREESFVAWRRLFEAVADVHPLVLVLEDLHWADEGTLDFVDYLLDWADDAPLLLVCTARPELLERRPTWGGGRLNSHTLALSPLPEDAAARLLSLLLERPVLDADQQTRLLRQVGGNPLYAEEYARMFAQGEAADVLPDTVQGVIAARLDLLDPAEKRVLQDAAVLGKVFWRGGIAALGDDEGLDETLQRLVRREFIRRDRASAMAGETEYAFRHALVRDVAYAQLPRASRVEKHRRAGAWIAATSLGRPDLVAHHYADALELAGAAAIDIASLEDEALVAFRAAGDHARALGAPDEAIAAYRRALELTRDSVERAHLELLLADVLTDLDPRDTLALAGRAREELESAGDLAGVAHAAVALSFASWQIGDGEGAWRWIEDAVAAAARSGSREALARSLASKTRMLMIVSRSEEAIRTGEDAVPLAESVGLQTVALNALNAVTVARADVGAEGWEEGFTRLVERAQALGDVGALQRALNNYASQVARIRGIAAARTILDQMEELVQRIPLPYVVRWTAAEVSWNAFAGGDWARALEQLDRFFAIQPNAPHYLQPEALLVRALIRSAGDDPGCFDDVEDALARARSGRDPQLLGPGLAEAALIALEWGRRTEAGRFAAELLELPPAARAIAAEFSTGIAWVAIDLEPRLGRLDGRGDSVCVRANEAIVAGRLEDAVELLASTGARTHAAHTMLRLARQRLEAGLDPEPWLEEAGAFYRGVGATRHVRQVEELRVMRRSA